MVKSLSYKASDRDIEEFFGSYGKVLRVNLLKSDDGRSKGIAFVKFEDEDAVEAAIKDSGVNFMDRTINIEKTKPRSEREGGSFGGRDGRDGGRDGRDSGRDRGDRGDRDRRSGGDDYRRENRTRDRSRERSRDGGDRGGDSQSKTVFVGNMNFSTDETSIRDFFDDCGGIKDVRVGLKSDGKVAFS